MRAVRVCLPGRPGSGEAGDPAGQVADAAEHPAHRGERAVRRHGQLGPAGALTPVPGGEHVGREPVGLVTGLGQAQRVEQPGLDRLGVRHAGDRRDDPAQDRVTQVRVFEPGAGRPGEADPLGQEFGELWQRRALLTVAPRVVGREPGGHREQVPDPDPLGVRGDGGPVAQLGNVLFGQVVEAERTLVPQRQHHGGGEALGHRRDPEHGVSVGDAAAGARGPQAAGVHQPALRHHAVGQARLGPALLVGLRQRVDRFQIRAGQLVHPGPPGDRGVPSVSARRPGRPCGCSGNTDMSQRFQ